ncbi:putative DNA repair and recombination helicase protein PIF3 [Leptomonas seymouri]|uniref:ATP-dependent DNA helicase n=1 Tax=Leptomonas seymouri TaxID=5684 RepID=A0A0N1PCJ6_LEPSE|nr:putative DNA repair and recombination helicase protein PIF3 [Leptomonas seymouri]|eukprot:KPI84004.1 putative DNA repair and recombination helicase protein PIF3 [Leptomonas seymouri]
MLSRLCMCRQACYRSRVQRNTGVFCSSVNRGMTRAYLLAAPQTYCHHASIPVTRKIHYSTVGKSRFSKAAQGEEERQYTPTFVPATAAAPSVSTLSSSQVAPPLCDAASEPSPHSASKEPECTIKYSRAPELSSALEQQMTTSSPTEMSSSELVALFGPLLNSAQWPPPAQQTYACVHNTDKTADPSEGAADTAPYTPLQAPTPMGLLAPRPIETSRVAQHSWLRTDSITTDKVSFDASQPASTPQLPGVYSDLFRDCFVNPFNGRLVNADSLSAKPLFRIGFYRSPVNSLHLEWSPTEYITALQKTMAEQQKLFESRKKKLLRQQRREQRVARAAAQLLTKKAGTTTAVALEGDSNNGTCGSVDVPMRGPQSSSHSLSVQNALSCETLFPAEAVAVARAKLLSPLRRKGPDHWMSKLADMMERRDVFTSLNKEMERLYSNLCTAYVPPKLDTPADASVANIGLTRDQEQVMQLALRGFNIFVGGSAGTGKTVLLKAIFRELTRLGLRVAMTATTGVAAVQLSGCTFHHAFNAPVDEKPHRWDANALRAMDVVMVDEVSLLDASMLDAFDMEARLARVHHVPFGGLQVIACGDFLQLSREATMPAYESAAFKYLVAVRLVTPMRHSASDPLLKLLDELRRGDFNAAQFRALDRSIPASATHITYIFPRRREAQLLNEAKLNELESHETTFTPQCGPLQLCGTFTASALIEIARCVKGAQKPLPRREQVLDMIHAEAQRILGDESGNDSGGLVDRIADHELVLMPVRAEVSTASTRFILRLRCRDPNVKASDVLSAGDGAPPAGVGVLGVNESASNLLSAAAIGAYTPTVRTTSANRMLSLTLRRNHRTVSPYSESSWRRIAAAVATQLGGRLVTMLSSEPASMVPLSVSMTLADMTSPEIAHSLAPLRLKLGCRVMVNRNLSRTVSNGSVGVVEAFAPPDASLFPRNNNHGWCSALRRPSLVKSFELLPIVRLLSGEVVQVPPVSLLVGGTAQSYYYGHEVFSIPLQLGYAFTVHKVQGLTLQGTVVLDCEKFFDCPHLIYVACSRVRRLDQLVVRHVEPRMIIVRRSALEFSDRLQDACTLNTHSLPSTYVRATWAQKVGQRILSLSD